MQSFEEFFKKKKIDLSALKRDNEALFEEFYDHYTQMGEISFDHTKKFWFNKLRKSYPLAEEAPTSKPASLVEEKTTAPVGQESSGEKPKGFTPRFKKAIPSDQLKAETAAESIKSETPNAKPAGFKPRFKAGATTTAPKPTQNEEDKAPEQQPQTEAPVAKPSGFTPRFKASVTKKTEDAVSENHPEAEEVIKTPKPTGFKPRFKAGATTAAPKPTQNEEDKAPEQQPQSEAPAAKPSGFTPRFKANVTKKAEDAATDKQSASQKPSGFVPRFKNNQTKNPEE